MDLGNYLTLFHHKHYSNTNNRFGEAFMAECINNGVCVGSVLIKNEKLI